MLPVTFLTPRSYAQVLVLLPFLGFFNNGIFSGFAIYLPELFPTEFRLRGVGICNAAGRSASIIVPLFVAPTFTQYGVGGVLTMMVVALLAMIIVVASLGEEPEREPAEEATVAA